jgi:hypothetical protein
MSKILQNTKLLALIGLFSAWPFIIFITNNFTDTIDYRIVFTVWLICILMLSLAATIVSFLPINDVFKRQIIHSGLVLFVCLFVFGAVLDIFQSEFGIDRIRWSFLAWITFIVIILGLVWQFSRNSTSSISLLFIVSVMCLAAGANIGNALLASSSIENPKSSNHDKTENTVQIARKSNVYYFLFDMYGRADSLREGLKFENAPFIKKLNNMGFWVGEKSFANYPMTRLSISSIMDLNYLIKPGPEALKNYTQYQIKLSGHNRVVKDFKAQGYKYVMAPPGSWAGTDCRGVEDICLRTESIGINETQITLLAMTPFAAILRRLDGNYLKFKRNEFPNMVKDIRATVAKSNKPVFVFSHLMMPHDPIYTADCRFRKEIEKIEESISNDRKSQYLDTIKCVNHQISEHIPKLIADDPSALIILQSDHGFSFGNFFDRKTTEWTKEEIKWRYGNLTAIRAPSRCRKNLYPSISAVNTFPFVMACLKKRSPNYLKDQLFLTKYKSNEVIATDLKP